MEKRVVFILLLSLIFLGCPPTPPLEMDIKLSNLPAEKTTENAIEVIVEGVNISAYKYKLDANNWSSEMEISARIIETNLAEGTHMLSVIGKDINGVWQKENAAVTYTWIIDFLPVAVLNNLPATITNQTSIDIYISGNIQAYKYKLDSEDFSSEAAVTVHIIRNNLAEGLHTITVLGKDNENNWQVIEQATSFSWEIDTTPPVIALLNQPFSQTSSTSINIMIANSDVKTYMYKLDAEPFSGERVAELNIQIDNLAEGSHTIQVIGKDFAENWQTIANATIYNWTINTSAPTVPITNAPPLLTSSTSINITVGGIGIVAYSYRLNYMEWSDEISVSTHIIAAQLSEGPNFLSITGKDNLGNWLTELVYSWEIDITPPAVEAGNNISWTKTSANLNAVSTDLHACTYLWEKINGTGTVNFGNNTQSSTTITGISGEEAIFTIRFTATDAVGNSASDTLLFNWDSKAPIITISDINWTGVQAPLNPVITDITPLTYLWQQISGSGTLIFGNTTSANTTVIGPDGTSDSYTIRLTVTDFLNNSSTDELILNWDAINPGAVTNLSGTLYAFQASLSWTNPGSDFTGVVIFRSTSTLSLSIQDGTQYTQSTVHGNGTVIYNASGSSYNNTGLQPSTHYYYTAYAYDHARNYSTPISINQSTTIPIAFVSTSGSDTNSGFTPALPKRTIQSAINAISNSGHSGELHVAAGTYNEYINLLNGVSLYGSYTTDWSTRNNLDRENVSYQTLISGSGSIARITGNNISSATIIDGFVINEGSGSQAAISLTNSNPTIRNNTITSGCGIYNNNSSPLIEKNLIKSAYTSTIYCIYNTNASSPLISRNHLLGGTSDSLVYGIYNTDASSPQIFNNIIYSGNGANNAYGIYAKDASAPIIINNTINGGNAGNSAYGIYIYYSAGLVIENNIIFTSSGVFTFGIYEYTETNPLAVRNNDIFDCLIFYRNGNGTEIININEINNFSDILSSGNISEDANFVNKAAGDWHLTTGTGVNIRAGGLNRQQYITTDYEGNNRTTSYTFQGIIDPTNEGAAGWTMGAYEY